MYKRQVFGKDGLVHSLDMLGSIANNRAIIPILANILIDAKHSGILFEAANMELSARVQAIGIVQQEGRFTVSAQRFANTIKELPPGEISIKLIDDKHFRIEADGGVYHLAGLPPDEYPEYPRTEGDPISVEGNELRTIVKRTLFAAGGEANPNLDAVHFVFSDECTTAVASNRVCISIATCSPVTETNIEKVTITRKSITEMLRIFAGSYEMTITTQEASATISDGVNTLVVRVIDPESFPKFDAVLEQTFDKITTIDRLKFIALLKRVSTLADPRNYLVNIKISEKEITATCKTPSLGDASDSIPFDESNGEIEINLNSRILLKLLANIESTSIHLAYSESVNPLVVESTTTVPTDLHKCMLMPLRPEWQS